MTPTHEHICFVYFAKSDTDKVIPEKETDEWKWCTLEEIDQLQPINDNTKFYAKKALEIAGIAYELGSVNNGVSHNL